MCTHVCGTQTVRGDGARLTMLLFKKKMFVDFSVCSASRCGIRVGSPIQITPGKNGFMWMTVIHREGFDVRV